VHVAKHAPQKESVKAPAKTPIKTTDNGERIVVKVLQPDGSLKEQSFPATPRH
jgi:hypothetical protein